jgi:hypothetical protein
MFGGIGGAIGGLAPAETPEYVETNEAILQNTLANYPIQETFQSAFLKEARARTSHTFVVVPEQGPQTNVGMVGQGVDIVLELSVQRIWLKRVGAQEGEIKQPMVWAIFVHARLMEATDKTEWYDQTFVHETDSHSYQVWPYYNRVQEAIEKAYQHLAEQVVEKLFLPKPTT